MTVSSTTSRVSYAGNNSTLVFAVPFRFLEDGDLVVLLQASGTDTVQILNTDYTVSGAGDNSGGSVTFAVAPTSSDTVVIYRDPTLEQLTDFTEGGAFPVETVEEALDRLTMLVQRLSDRLDRAPTLVEGDTDGSGRYDFNGNRGINADDPVDATDVATKGYVTGVLADAALGDYAAVITAFGASLIDDADGDEALDTLGVSAFAKTLLDDADGGTAQSTLGITAFAKTLLDDTDAATARTTLGVSSEPVPYKNLLVNGDFQVWQLGTSITSSTTPANNDATYVCDQWLLLAEANNVVNVARETSVVPAYAPSALKATTQGTANKFGFLQPLPNDLVRGYSGSTVSLQFKARMSGGGNLTKLMAVVLAWDGTADSITKDAVQTWGADGAGVTAWATGWSAANTPSLLTALTTSYQTYTITGITVPASTDNLAVFIWVDDKAYTSGDVFYLADVKLEQGTAASAIEHKPFQEELARCQDFYFKTFAADTAPAQNVGTDGALEYVASGTAAGKALSYSWRFPRKLFKVPSITTYNPGSGTAGYWMRELPSAGGVFEQASADRIGTSGCRIYNVTAVSDGYMYTIHAVADARL